MLFINYISKKNPERANESTYDYLKIIIEEINGKLQYLDDEVK